MITVRILCESWLLWVLTPEGFPVAYEVFDGDTGKNTVFVGNGELYGDPEFNRGIALRYCPVAETVAGILVRRFVLSVARPKYSLSFRLRALALRHLNRLHSRP